MKFASWLTAAVTLGVAAPAGAHHSAAAEYRSEVRIWTGTVIRFAWINPHSWVYFDSTDSSGKTAHWECEGSAPGGLMRAGWTKETLHPGMLVTVEGYPAKDRPQGCKVKAIILPGGRRMTMGLDEPGGR